MSTPSETLTARILDRLVHEGLLDEKQRGRMAPKLTDGSLSAEDWRLLVELSMTPRGTAG